ncbi:MAG: hypothetical protein GEU82_07355 [Luteitalea sp.]|nr:hypothetical protein [Luteitalea sp.]
MRILVFGLLIPLAAFAGGTAPLAAQSLADVARKEEARRKSVGESGKTYTNKDLATVPATGPNTAGAGSGSAGSGSTAPGSGSTPIAPADTPAAGAGVTIAQPPAAAGDQSPVKDQAYWSKRASDLREQVERDSTYAEAMQTRINALTTDFTNRDDPQQRAQIGVDRQKALNELDRLKKAIADGQQAIADLEEEARRAGVPAGWLR